MLFDDAHLAQGVAIDSHHAVVAWINSELNDDSSFGPIRHELVVVDVDGIGRALVAWPAVDDSIFWHLLCARAFAEALDNLRNQALIPSLRLCRLRDIDDEPAGKNQSQLGARYRGAGERRIPASRDQSLPILFRSRSWLLSLLHANYERLWRWCFRCLSCRGVRLPLGKQVASYSSPQARQVNNQVRGWRRIRHFSARLLSSCGSFLTTRPAGA